MGKREEIRERIKAGKTVLGIELGSTRIKAVLIDAPLHLGAMTGKTSMWTISGLMIWTRFGKGSGDVTEIW